MQLYLPIAEMSLNIFLVIGLGALVGFLSGMFGVGGGFLMTPFLIFVGVPPTVAVATGANLISASSVSGALAYWRRGGVDLKMGVVLTLGGAVGSVLGAWLFAYLETIGQVELAISLAFVLFLGAIGGIMVYESLAAIARRQRGRPGRRRRRRIGWLHALPWKVRFRKSRLYISILLPLGIGAAVGALAALLGVGGGFIMIPAMIYLIGMPASVVVGTSLFQIIFITATITVLHSVNTQSVDVLLTLLLLAGAVFGAQAGARIGGKLKAEELRALLGLIVLGVCLRMGWDLVAPPGDLYSVSMVSG